MGQEKMIEDDSTKSSLTTITLDLPEIYEAGWVEVDEIFFDPHYRVGFEWIAQRRRSGELDGH